MPLFSYIILSKPSPQPYHAAHLTSQKPFRDARTRTDQEKEGKTHTHSSDNGDKEVLAILESGLDLLANVRVGDLDVVLGVTVTVNQVEEFLYVSAAFDKINPFPRLDSR